MTAAEVYLLTRERELQEAVRQLFRWHGWWVRHTWDSRNTEKGDPDLMLIKAGRLVFAELKVDKAKVTTEQATVIDALRQCGVEAYLWETRDWSWIEAVAKGERAEMPFSDVRKSASGLSWKP